MKRLELHADEKRFFRLVKRAVGTNPFSDERASVDRQLLQDKSPPAGKRLLDEVIQAVELKLRKVCAGQLKPLQCFQDEDRELVQYGCLFHLFHKYCSQFDEHIVQQIDSGDTPCRVGFADRAIAEMVDYGIPRREARRFFALFFQMRRAFFFIGQIIGKSQCMKELRLSLWNNIFTHDIWLYDRFLWNRLEDFSTMLLGSTGTGKGLAASAIGRGGYIPFDERTGCFSESFTKVFIAVNLSQFAEQLVESELFGHKKGAFTGAVEKHTGTFSLCSKSGAIFLDEIGEVSIPIQIKLLQVLQDRFFTPVGSRRQERFHGRVIAATNQPIEKLRLKKVFRDDFYYRLCSDIIEVPSLAERIRQDPEELEILMVHMVKRITGEEAEELAWSTLKILRTQIAADYPWPGNVRELEQCVRRILLKQKYEGDKILLQEDGDDSLAKGLVSCNLGASQLLAKYCKVLYAQLGTYEAVARRTELDRRTVKKYIDS